MKTSNKAGFTLIELLIVIAILAIVAALLAPAFKLAREKDAQKPQPTAEQTVSSRFHIIAPEETINSHNYTTVTIFQDTVTGQNYMLVNSYHGVSVIPVAK
jgi:prepilin-type N-terminal cleavage/methylation domain-containing protein